MNNFKKIFISNSVNQNQLRAMLHKECLDVKVITTPYHRLFEKEVFV